VPSTDTLAGTVRRFVENGQTKTALELLYERHHSDVRRFVRFGRPGEAVDDVCQEVWLAVQRSLPGFRFETSPVAWILSIARFKVADSHRYRRLRGNDVEFDSRDPLLDGVTMGPRRPRTPASQMERKEQLEALEAALLDCDPLDREFLELRYICGLRPAEIVEILALDLSPNALSQRLVRALRRLRGQLVKAS
jgi:RNA polymerase sigma factor (sigma-70 family)